MHADGDWQAVEGVLIKDVSTASEYLQIWKLKFRTPNTGSAVLHPNSKEAKRELKAKPQQNPSILFRNQIPWSNVGQVAHVSPTPQVTSQMMKAHAALLRRFACFGWVCRAAMLRTATLVLIHSTTEHCPAVWCRSAHTRLIDLTIHDVLRIVTRCLRPAPVDNLPILAGTEPAELRRKGTTLSLSRRAMALGYLPPTPVLGGARIQGHVNKVVL